MKRLYASLLAVVLTTGLFFSETNRVYSQDKAKRAEKLTQVNANGSSQKKYIHTKLINPELRLPFAVSKLVANYGTLCQSPDPLDPSSSTDDNPAQWYSISAVVPEKNSKEGVRKYVDVLFEDSELFHKIDKGDGLVVRIRNYKRISVGNGDTINQFLGSEEYVVSDIQSGEIESGYNHLSGREVPATSIFSSQSEVIIPGRTSLNYDAARTKNIENLEVLNQEFIDELKILYPVLKEMCTELPNNFVIN